MKTKCDHGDHIVCNECTEPADLYHEVENGDYIIVVNKDNLRVSLRHKNGKSWSDTVRAMNHLINELNKPTMKPAGDVAHLHLKNGSKIKLSKVQGKDAYVGTRKPIKIDQAQLHADDYVDKNYPDEREVSKLKEEAMQNKPQLSVELGEKFYTSFGSLIVDDNGNVITKKIEAFLATALEEQKQEILSEVDGWLDEMPIYMETDGYSGDKPSFAPFRAELRAKLNQLKGNHE